jgi:hypothetical protein
VLADGRAPDSPAAPRSSAFLNRWAIIPSRSRNAALRLGLVRPDTQSELRTGLRQVKHLLRKAIARIGDAPASQSVKLAKSHTSNAPSNSKIQAIKSNVMCFQLLASRLVTTALLKSGAVHPFRAHDKSIDNSGLCAHPRSPACFRVSRHAAALSQHRSQITRDIIGQVGRPVSGLAQKPTARGPRWTASRQLFGESCRRKLSAWLANACLLHCGRGLCKKTNWEACIDEAIVAPGNRPTLGKVKNADIAPTCLAETDA